MAVVILRVHRLYFFLGFVGNDSRSPGLIAGSNSTTD
jgi:hypothetical protein